MGFYSGEGLDVGKQIDEWIEKMDDYYNPCHSYKENKAVMCTFKLEKQAINYGGKTIA